MPIVKKILQNFIKEYGKKEGIKRYFAWENANPGKYKKSLKTARKHKDKILRHLRKRKRKKRKLSIDERISKLTGGK